MKYKYIIFDFDGTLFDSRKGIVNSIKHALDSLNLKHPSEETLTSFIGPPLGKSFQNYFGLSKMDTEFAIVKLREYYEEFGHMDATPYPGGLDLIKELHQHKLMVGIATAKPTVYTTRILLGHLWTSYFHSIRGSDLKGELFPKEKTIGQVISDFKVFDVQKEECIMVGDTIYDIKGAQAHGIDSVAVNYGYGKTQDLKDARPTYFVEDIKELQSILY